MSKLPLKTRVQILSMLVEGSSMRSISRVCDVSINTVTKLLVDAGETALAVHHAMVCGVKSGRVQCDEIWSFCYAKEKNVATAKAAPDSSGDVWTWTALDSETKLIVSYFVGDRSGQSAMILKDDLRSRLANRVQLTTDGHRAYLEAVEGAFGADIDYAQLVKLYGEAPDAEKRYRPAECIGTRKTRIEGDPDPNHVSTSHVERQNLTMRMSMRRFTRLTNAHSNKLANHIHALALYFLFYNFCRIHSSLRVTPAMTAGLTNTALDMEWIVGLIDARAPKTGRPSKNT